MNQTTPHEKTCGAKTRSGKPCANAPMIGKTRCKFHGGMSLAGAESATFKHGQRSQHLPTRLAARYEAAQSDPELGSLINNIALNEAFIREKLDTLEEGGDAASAWVELQKQHKALTKAYHSTDDGGMVLALANMKDVIDQRLMYHQTITEIQHTLAEQRKDLLAKAQIELKETNAVPVDQFMTFIGALTALINNVIPEKEKRNAIADGINKIISIGTRDRSAS